MDSMKELNLENDDFENWCDRFHKMLFSDSGNAISLQFDNEKIVFFDAHRAIYEHLKKASVSEERIVCLKLMQMLYQKCLNEIEEKKVYLDESYKETMFNIGMDSYEKKYYGIAEYIFRDLAQRGSIAAKNNLAYMIRRKETNSLTGQEIKEAMLLLHEGIDERDAFALVNMALIFALNFGGEDDWVIADLFISDIQEDVKEVYNWWKILADSGDAEGSLIHWWLLRHKKIRKSTLGTKEELESIVKQKIENVPVWI